jgi:SnoaL-like domain
MSDDNQPSDRMAVRYALYRNANEAARGTEVELIVNSIIEIDGSRARASSVRLRLGGTDRAPQLVACDRVDDELVRRSDGEWELERRTVAGGPSGDPAQ